jgi:hypothetical protein
MMAVQNVFSLLVCHATNNELILLNIGQYKFGIYEINA